MFGNNLALKRSLGFQFYLFRQIDTSSEESDHNKSKLKSCFQLNYSVFAVLYCQLAILDCRLPGTYNLRAVDTDLFPWSPLGLLSSQIKTNCALEYKKFCFVRRNNSKFLEWNNNFAVPGISGFDLVNTTIYRQSHPDINQCLLKMCWWSNSQTFWKLRWKAKHYNLLVIWLSNWSTVLMPPCQMAHWSVILAG